MYTDGQNEFMIVVMLLYRHTAVTYYTTVMCYNMHRKRGY